MNDFDPQLRDYFDDHFDRVIAQMPPQVHALLDQVTMYVEDYPAPHVLQQTGATRHSLCGLYTGIPLTKRNVEISGVLSDAIYIYRQGVLTLASNRAGRLRDGELQKQIRITVLHELGHHFGLDEEDLQELGYA